ncbi:MAG: hypothetical protein SH868_13250 [Bythopirellula sp.]|nr:hypothetical protein [Bythopirellula sp.]
MDKRTDRDANPDAITGAPGSHPVGTGLGAAAGGAAAGAAAGLAGGPIGAAIGAVIGGVAGGYAGKAVAEQIDPTAEEAYWRDEYRNRDYYDPNADFDAEIAPAYRYGWESRSRHESGNWNDVEGDLRDEWQSHRGESRLDWDQAMPATRDAWNRIDAYHGDLNDDDTTVANRPK